MDSKTYYLVQFVRNMFRLPFYATKDVNSGTMDRGFAEKFALFSDALAATVAYARADNQRAGFQIIRVEETPGTTQRVVLLETEDAPAGAVVQYALQTADGPFAGTFMAASRVDRINAFGHSLDNAPLYKSQPDALLALQKAAMWVERHHTGTPYLSDSLVVVRVAVVNGAPTITEKVL